MSKAKKDELTVKKAKQLYKGRRFVVVLILILLNTICMGLTFLLVWRNHSQVGIWNSLMVIVLPIMLGGIVTWVGIESTKVKGGQND